MTTEEFEKIALWMGWVLCQDHHGHYWADNPNGEWCADIDTVSLETWEVQAPNRLVEKGYDLMLVCIDGRWTCAAERDGGKEMVEDHPTQREAVEQALLQIADKEAQ